MGEKKGRDRCRIELGANSALNLQTISKLWVHNFFLLPVAGDVVCFYRLAFPPCKPYGGPNTKATALTWGKNTRGVRKVRGEGRKQEGEWQEAP